MITEILTPLEMEEPIQYCIRAELPGVLNTWKQIAEHYNIDVPATQSAKIAIQRATKRTIQPVTQGAANELQNALINFIASQPVGMDEVRVIQLIKEYGVNTEAIQEAIRSIQPKVDHVLINLNGIETKVSGRQHSIFKDVLTKVSCGMHVYLYGPAGTGKTQLAENIAKAINKEFYCLSVGNQTTKSDLMGFISANGQYITTPFRASFEHGGLFLLDEIDAGNANVITCLNAALANGVCSFPDGMVKKHPDFTCIAAANTFGTGSDRMYVGRNQLDAASLDRFVQVVMNYDELLEQELSPTFAPYFKKFREILKGERVVLSTRRMLYCETYQQKTACSPLNALEEMLFTSLPSELAERLRKERTI